MLVVTIYKRSIETHGVWNSTNVLSKVTAEFHCCAFLIMFTDENRLTVMYKQMLKWTETMRLSNKFIQNITLTLNIVLRLNMLLKKSVWATKYTFCYGVYTFCSVMYYILMGVAMLYSLRLNNCNLIYAMIFAIGLTRQFIIPKI